MNYDREIDDALRDDPPPIDSRYYGYYSDEVRRMGARWVEERVEEWEDDHPGEKGE